VVHCFCMFRGWTVLGLGRSVELAVIGSYLITVSHGSATLL